VEQLSRKKVVWIVPNFHELAWAGAHQFNQTSVLDMILPSIEESSVILIGETRPASYDRLVQSKPQPDWQVYDQNQNKKAVFQQFKVAQSGRLRIVRRYREHPSPLVRDNVLEWRTGRLDAVLNGDFQSHRGDLMISSTRFSLAISVSKDLSHGGNTS